MTPFCEQWPRVMLSPRLNSRLHVACLLLCRRWTAFVCMPSVFVVIPVILLALSLAGTGGLVVDAVLLSGGVGT